MSPKARFPGSLYNIYAWYAYRTDLTKRFFGISNPPTLLRFACGSRSQRIDPADPKFVHWLWFRCITRLTPLLYYFFLCTSPEMMATECFLKRRKFPPQFFIPRFENIFSANIVSYEKVRIISQSTSFPGPIRQQKFARASSLHKINPQLGHCVHYMKRTKV